MKHQTQDISVKSIADIFDENHKVVQPTMKQDVDALVDAMYTAQNGLVIGEQFGIDIATTYYHVLDLNDDGHLEVLGYIISKWSGCTNQHMRRLLKEIDCEKRKKFMIYFQIPHKNAKI